MLSSRVQSENIYIHTTQSFIMKKLQEEDVQKEVFDLYDD